MQGNFLTFLADAPLQPSTYQRYDIRDWLKHLNPRFEIIYYEYFIVHTPWNDYLELSTHTTTKNFALVYTLSECNFTIWRIYILPSIWNTAPMNILFHARWSDHPEIIMHTNSQNLSLCWLTFFFFSQSKRVQKKKWSREVKYICQQLKLQSTSYSALVNSLSCICSDTSIV